MGSAVEAQDKITISDSAAKRIAVLMRDEPAGAMVRITVSGGGCAGFQYGFSFDTERHEDDRVFERDNVAVVVDEVSLDLVAGSELDFVDELGASAFALKNPNATSSCGCGTSFAI